MLIKGVAFAPVRCGGAKRCIVNHIGDMRQSRTVENLINCFFFIRSTFVPSFNAVSIGYGEVFGRHSIRLAKVNKTRQ